MLKSVVVVALLFVTSPVLAHCDWIDGPVVVAARAALEKGDVAPLLRWVPASDEDELRRAFVRTLAVRGAGADARDVDVRDLAEQWFLETVIRLHRLSEGEPFTGLKGADYHPEPGIVLADHALEANSLAELEATLTTALRAELRSRFAAVAEAAKHADHDAEAGRRWVRAYAEFVHYVEGVHRSATAPASHDAHP
jgi:hypothetical protein